MVGTKKRKKCQKSPRFTTYPALTCLFMVPLCDIITTVQKPQTTPQTLLGADVWITVTLPKSPPRLTRGVSRWLLKEPAA